MTQWGLQSQFRQTMDVLNKANTTQKHNVNLQHVWLCNYSNSPDTTKDPDTENTDETTGLAVEDDVVIN